MPKLTFKSKTPVDKANYNQAMQDLLKSREAVAEMANRCLMTEDFKRYRENLIKFRSLVVRQILDFVEPTGDIVKYGVAISNMTTEVRTAECLLKNIEKDLRNNPNKEK